MPNLLGRQRSWGTRKPNVGARLRRTSPVAPKTLCCLFNEGAGVTCYNRAMQSANGTLSGAFLRSAGRGDQAIELNTTGTTGKVSFPGTSLGATHWASMWIYPMGGASYGLLYGDQGGTAGLYYRAATNKLDMVFTPGGDHLNNTALTLNTWNHVAISINGGSGTFYLNGKADGTFASWPGTTFDRLGLDNFADDWIGRMESFMASNGEYLTPTEVWSLYRDRYGMFQSPPPLRLVKTAPIIFAETSSGGITFGGSSTPSITYPLSTSGGLTLGGSSSPSLTYALSSSGGIRFGGSSAVTLTLPPNLIGAIIAYCQGTSAISSLVPGGIWHNVAKATQMPFAVFTGITSRPTFNLSDSYWKNDLIQLCVYAADDLDASNIADAIVSQLSPKAGTTRLQWTNGYEMSRFPGNSMDRQMPERFKDSQQMWQSMREIEFLNGTSF